MLRGCILCEIVAEAKHRGPPIAVQIVNRPAGSDDEIVLFAQLAQSRAHLQMEMGVISGIHGDDGGWWASVGEHADQDQICIVDPVEGVVATDIVPSLVEEIDTTFGGLQIGVELVIDVLRWMNVRDGALARVRVC